MRLGLSSYACTWAVGIAGFPPERPMGAVDLLERAASLGVHVVQVADNLPLDRLSAGELDAFAARAAALGIEIEVGTRGIGPEQLRAYLRLAQRLRSRILRVVVDTAERRPGEDEIVETLRALTPEMERADVCLAIENHDRHEASTLARIIERVASSHVGICLDTTNSLGALEGPAVVVDTLAPYAVNLHLKDVVVRRANQMMGFIIEGRPLGQGQMDIPRILQKLRALHRDPNCILELWTPPEATLAATIAKEASWAQASVEYVRRFISD